MKKSTIDWTEFSWNPITGCTKISPTQVIQIITNCNDLALTEEYYRGCVAW